MTKYINNRHFSDLIGTLYFLSYSNKNAFDCIIINHLTITTMLIFDMSK